MVTRKPCLLAIMQEGSMPQLPGKSLKVFKKNNIGKITQDIGPKSSFLHNQCEIPTQSSSSIMNRFTHINRSCTAASNLPKD
jgi:hypothetical protein